MWLLALSELLIHAALRENDSDLQHNFLIGLAYLSGIDVEAEAQQLITGAVEEGIPEATQRLVDMYRTGNGVDRDYRAAIQWQDRLAALYCTNYESEKTKNSDYIDGSVMWAC